MHLGQHSAADLPGCARRFPEPAEQVLSVRIDQVREVLVRNALRGPPGRTFLRHSERSFKSLKEKRTYSKVRNKAKHIEMGRKALWGVSNIF